MGRQLRAWAPLAAVAAAGLLAVGGCTDEPGVSDVAGPDRGPASPVRFVDVAGEVGVDFQHGAFHWDVSPDPVAMMGGGVCWLDYDGDGWLDLYAVNSWSEQERSRWIDEEGGGLPRNALFHNDQGRFTDVSAGSGADLEARGSGCVAADFDLDGRTDLYVTTDSNGALLWNEGGGRFTEGAVEAGASGPGWLAGAAAGDVDGNGWPDLFLAGYTDLNADVPGATSGFPGTNLGVRDLLYLNQGRGDGERVTFREVGAEAGLEVVAFEYGLGAMLSDLDADGDLDIYVANDTKPNRLYDNVPWPGGVAADPAGLGFRFEEMAGRAGVADPNAGMGLAEGDLDANGRVDLFVTNARGQVHGAFLGQEPTVADPSFLDVRNDVGADLSGSTGWGVSFADFDLDTDLDVLFVNGAIPVVDMQADAEPMIALENDGPSGSTVDLADVSDAFGLAEVGPLLARGSATADYDNDGDLDIAVSSIGSRLVLLRNDSGGGSWLEVALEGFHPGAVVTVVLPDGSTLEREILAGSSYLSSEDPRAHFGLGDATTIDEVVVRWPGGEETRLTDIAPNRRIEVSEP
jgi:ASPIC and UnbV/FG-GAP-like repeat